MTYKQARRRALVVYKKALRAAERDDWEKAEDLSGEDCAFCRVGQSDCPNCPAHYLCWTRIAHGNAFRVLIGQRSKPNGLRHFRKTIEQLEALEV